MGRSRTLALALAALLSVGVAVPEARAGEPSATDAETALHLYKDGKVLRDKGDTTGALAKFRAAYALAATPITALELARTYAATGQLVEAREIALAVARIPLRRNESQKSGEARRDADALAASLKPRLASLLVRVKGAGQPPPNISVDGVVVPPEAVGEPRIVNPGRHVVTIDVGGRTKQGELTLAEGRSGEIELEAPEGSAEPPPPPGDGAEPSRGRSPLVFFGFGAALIGVAVGTTTGLMTLAKASSLKDACRDSRCPPSSQSDLDSSSTTAMISTVGFIVAGVGLGVGVAGLFLSGGEPDPPSASGPSARVFLTPTGAGVRGTFF